MRESDPKNINQPFFIFSSAGVINRTQIVRVTRSLKWSVDVCWCFLSNGDAFCLVGDEAREFLFYMQPSITICQELKFPDQPENQL